MIHPKYRQLSLQALFALMTFVAIFAAHVAWSKERSRKSLAMVERFNTAMSAQQYDEAEAIAVEFAAYSAGRDQRLVMTMQLQAAYAQIRERREFSFDSATCYNQVILLEDFICVIPEEVDHTPDVGFKHWESLRSKREKLASSPANVSHEQQ